MLVQELFAKDGITCPDWLSFEEIDNDWIDSTYSHTSQLSIWTIKRHDKHCVISFDGETYTFEGFHPKHDDLVIFNKVITESGEFIT